MLNLTSTQWRRFILGKQGLWPGRRWCGKEGIAKALRAIEAIQIDPVSIMAPSAEIVLWGRVAHFNPEDLHTLMYEERQFFDYGGALFIYPMDELPYWRVMMEQRKQEPRWAEFANENFTLFDEVKSALRERGPLRNRDLSGKVVQHYRGSKVTSVALYYLWLTGELMTHRRHGKERVYDFLENVAPPHLQDVAEIDAASEFLTLKAIQQWGYTTPRHYRNVCKNVTGRPVTIADAKVELAERVIDGRLTEIKVAQSRTPHYVLSDDVPLIREILCDGSPSIWNPIKSTTSDEVTFLSPLEYVSARGRATELFDFDYIWEIYKPEAKRQYGPYTLPILYGDQLVGRIDAKVERSEKRLIVNGVWLEPWFKPDRQFRFALDQGLARLMEFVKCENLLLPTNRAI